MITGNMVDINRLVPYRSNTWRYSTYGICFFNPHSRRNNKAFCSYFIFNIMEFDKIKILNGIFGYKPI